MNIRNNQPDQLPATGLKRASEILRYLPFKKSKLYTMVAEGKFPSPIRVGSMSCWRCEEVYAWLAAQGTNEKSNAKNGGV